MNRGKKSVLLLCMGALLVCGFWMTIPGRALAITDGQEDPGYTPASSLNVDVGYYGMEHYAKGNYSLGTMEALGGSGREIYTFIDKNRRPVTGEAEGIWLGSFLDAVGVDRAAVNRYHFYSSDNYMGEAGMEVTEQRLFEIPRYSFSDTVLTHVFYARLNRSAGFGAIPVQTQKVNRRRACNSEEKNRLADIDIAIHRRVAENTACA